MEHVRQNAGEPVAVGAGPGMPQPRRQGQPGAWVAVSSTAHADTLNDNVATEFNGEYIVIARTTDSEGNQIPFPNFFIRDFFDRLSCGLLYFLIEIT